MAASPLLDRFGRPLVRPSPSAATGGPQRFYRSASQDTQSPYNRVRMEGIEKLLSPWDWQTLLTGSRGLFANFGPVRGAAIQKSNAAVGTSYLPDYLGSNKAWGERAKEWLIDNWMPISDVRGAPFTFRQDLWLDSLALDRDGDFFYLLTSHGQSGLPAIQHLGAHRCQTGPGDIDGTPTRFGPYRGALICNGVLKNRDGRAIAYRIKVGDGYSRRDFEDISARDLRHGFDPEWHDQGRGIPVGAHALRFLQNSLQSHEWEHVALMMLSSIGLIERNSLGAPDADDVGNTLGESSAASTGERGLVRETFEGGTVRYYSTLDPGSGLESIKAERPGDEWDRFQDRTVRLWATGAKWPYELCWKSDEVNGVTIRNIQARANQSAEERQCILDRHARTQVSYALAAAVRLRRLPTPPSVDDYYRWTFRHPPKISIDPGRDTASEIAAIAARHTTLKEVVESRGGTLSEHFDRIIEAEMLWNEKRTAAGLDPLPTPPPSEEP